MPIALPGQPIRLGVRQRGAVLSASVSGGGVPVTPTPTGANLVLHLDASNASSVPQSAGLVSAWTDLVTGTYQCTAAGALRPTWVASAYGPFSLPTIRFGGTQYLVGGSVFANLNGTSHTIVCIMKLTSGTGAQWFGNSSNTENDGFTMATQSTPRWNYVIGTGSTAVGILGPATIPAALQMVIGVQDSTGGGAIPGGKNQGIYVDSTTLSASGTSAYAANTTVAPAVGGSSYSVGTHVVVGDLCEILGYNGALNNTDIHDLHTYSQAKWGTA